MLFLLIAEEGQMLVEYNPDNYPPGTYAHVMALSEINKGCGVLVATHHKCQTCQGSGVEAVSTGRELKIET